MTPQELENWRVAMRLSLVTDLVGYLFSLVGKVSPETRPILMDFLDSVDESRALILPPGLHQAEEAMLIEEHREAYAHIISAIKQKINE